MKKLIKILAVIILLVVVAAVVASFFLGSIIKTGVETVGPKVAKVPIKLESASLSLLGGSGGLSGLVVGNPEGYKSDSAIKVGKVSLAVSPGSVLSDKLVIKSIKMESPQITMEGGLTENNLTKIQKNIEAFTGPSTKTEDKADKSAAKKLQVDDFQMSGAKVTAVVMGKSVTLPIPDIHFTNLGQGADGITAADLTKKVIGEIISGSIKAVAKGAMDLGGKGTELLEKATKDLGGKGTETLDKATKGIGDLFNKK